VYKRALFGAVMNKLIASGKVDADNILEAKIFGVLVSESYQFDKAKGDKVVHFYIDMVEPAFDGRKTSITSLTYRALVANEKTFELSSNMAGFFFNTIKDLSGLNVELASRKAELKKSRVLMPTLET
jgi:hypothetical protein